MVCAVQQADEQYCRPTSHVLIAAVKRPQEAVSALWAFPSPHSRALHQSTFQAPVQQPFLSLRSPRAGSLSAPARGGAREVLTLSERRSPGACGVGAPVHSRACARCGTEERNGIADFHAAFLGLKLSTW